MNNTYQEVFALAKDKGYDCGCKDFKQLEELTTAEFCNTQILTEATLIQKWLRENHEIHIVIRPELDNRGKTVYDWDLYNDTIPSQEIDNQPYTTYEGALMDALYEALIDVVETVTAEQVN